MGRLEGGFGSFLPWFEVCVELETGSLTVSVLGGCDTSTEENGGDSIVLSVGSGVVAVMRGDNDCRVAERKALGDGTFEGAGGDDNFRGVCVGATLDGGGLLGDCTSLAFAGSCVSWDCDGENFLGAVGGPIFFTDEAAPVEGFVLCGVAPKAWFQRYTQQKTNRK